MSDTASQGGIGFFGLLAIVFITLKLTGFITWPWIWVLAPIWGPFAAVLAFFLGCAAFATVCALIGS